MIAAELERVFDRRLQEIFPSRKEALERLSNAKLRIYVGIDPTGPLHIGHLIPLKFLHDLAELGHKPVVVIGDFTATIGDPTGKDRTRVALTEEQVQTHMEDYIRVLKRILPVFEVQYNSAWLKSLSFADVLHLASTVTVQQMIARDMFQERIKKEKPIYVHEFLYPLMQGYDSVALKIDGEVGGNDQTFNMLVGRDLSQKYLKKEKIVFATKLLVDPVSGKKMSKTEDNFIALADKPQEIRRKVLSFPDELVPMVFQLCTDAELADVPKDPREAKEKLADELTEMLHGNQAAEQTREPLEIPLRASTLAALLKETNVVDSMSEAKDLISHRGVLVNGEVAQDWNATIKSGDTIQIGKGRFYRVS